jgi:OmpA-OmpF porin, OOP family
MKLLPVLLLLTVPALSQSTVENLGNQVNSEFSEVTPVISPDGRTLYFARIQHPDNTFGDKGGPDTGKSQDIWYSEFDTPSGKWGPARRLGSPLNREEINAAFGITPDGTTLLLKGAFDKGVLETTANGRGVRGFSLSKRTASGWSAPQKIDIPNYVAMCRGEFDSGYLAADGKVLLLAFSEKKNSIEDDLYVCFRQKDGSWTKPMSLGPELNTAFTETTPFLASDGATLYFSSDRTGGQGSNDVYVTRRVDKTWKHWSKPQNLGPNINTDGYDAFYSVAAPGDFAYMTSTKNTLGKTDIVRINLRPAAPAGGVPDSTLAARATSGRPDGPVGGLLPDPVALISGRVIDQKTGRPIEARIVYELLEDGSEAGIANSDPLTGEYKVVLPVGKKYTMRAIGKDYIAEGENIDLTDTKQYREIKGKELKLVPIEVGQSVRLNNIFFETGKSELRPESNSELDRVVATLTENPKMTIDVGGHTDNVGSNETNLKLSQDRADAVREYVIGKGVEPDRVGGKGFGETKPVAPNDTDEGRQRNRRVEFIITKK